MTIDPKPNTVDLQDGGVGDLLSQDIPYKLGKYEIRNELGRGTCGVVYKGFDPFVRRDVAIKVGWADPTSAADPGDDPHLNFFNEAHAAGKLQHPNIIAVYDAQMEKELSYIVMEYVEGETLLEYCRKDGQRLPPGKVLECIFKCCLALDYSHTIGVIHRDIKPSNIMLSREGETKLMDFSVAEVTQSRRISPSMIIGSPSYMSPEQILRRKVGAQSDLYSLAAVTYQLLTGERLFQGREMKQVFTDIVQKPAPRLSDKRPDLPKALSDILEKALKKDPAARFQSGKEMAAELTSVYDHLIYAGNNVSHSEQRHILKGLRFFNEFEPDMLDELMTAGNVLSFTAGELISQEGDIDHSFYIIARGRADVTRSERHVVTLYRGDCFGETGFLSPGERATTIRAATEAAVLKINRVHIDNLSVEARMLFYKAFSENLIHRLASPDRSHE